MVKSFTLSFLIMFGFSNRAIAASFFPCSAGIRHVDRNNEIKEGVDRVIITSASAEENFAARIGSSNFNGPAQKFWSHPIDYLSYNLASEIYGTEYYVEMCYLGPQKQLVTVGGQVMDVSEGIYRADYSLVFSHFINVPLYRESAQLYVRYELSCDLRKRGLNMEPRLESEFPTTEIERDVWISTEYAPFTSDSLNWAQFLNEQSTQVPRFCTLKMYFLEGSSAPRKYKLSVKDVSIDSGVSKN